MTVSVAIHLQVFSTPLYYNRLTATFDELLPPSERSDADEDQSKSVGSISQQQQQQQRAFGATDEERERMMLWAKKERLPMFTRHERHI